MGRRFGRTKRRKLRQEVRDKVTKEFDHIVDELSKERSAYMNQYYDLQGQIRKWWDRSVLLDPKTEAVISQLPPYWKVPLSQPLKPLFYSAEIMTPIEYHHQTLEALNIAMYEDLGERHCHVRLSCGKDQIGYYLDSRVFETFEGFPHQVLKYVTEAIAHEFAKKYRGSKT